jgi:hypothetical protein
LIKGQDIQPTKAEAGTQLIMKCSSRTLFTEEEKNKALLVSQRIIELRKRRGEMRRKKSNDEEA